jgi:hypothetical protein
MTDSARRAAARLKAKGFLPDASRLDRLQAYESGLPLHKRKFFTGLPGDYQIIDENGRTVWASEWCHKAYVSTCPRLLLRRGQ